MAAALPFVPQPAQAIWPFADDGWGEERPLGERAAAVLARSIAIPTVNPPGNEAALARFFVEVAHEAGLEARVVPVPGPEDEDGVPLRAAAWARLPGAGREGGGGGEGGDESGAGPRPIVLLSHLDVVPANPDEWTVPPFEGRIEDGRVIGRGALDAKGVAVVQLMALVELARRDEPLVRDVIWLATPDEEAGGQAGAGWVTREQPQLLGGADLLLTEGGSVRVGASDTPEFWSVAVTEKSPCWIELSARGPPGHTSAPRPEAAVPRLVAALDAIRRVETRVRVLPEVQRMFATRAPAVPDAADRAAWLDLRTALDSDRRFRRRFLDNPTYNALVRNTISISVLEGAPRTNVAPAVARAHLDARLLPGERCEDFAGQLANVIGDPAVSLRVLLSFPSGSSPVDSPLYRAIERVAARTDPGTPVVPGMTAGFTDAHYFRAIGIASYGFVPRWLRAEETAGIHGTNEEVSIQNLERGTRTLVAILEELDASSRARERE